MDWGKEPNRKHTQRKPKQTKPNQIKPNKHLKKDREKQQSEGAKPVLHFCPSTCLREKDTVLSSAALNSGTFALRVSVAHGIFYFGQLRKDVNM